MGMILEPTLRTRTGGPRSTALSLDSPPPPRRRRKDEVWIMTCGIDQGSRAAFGTHLISIINSPMYLKDSSCPKTLLLKGGTVFCSSYLFFFLISKITVLENRALSPFMCQTFNRRNKYISHDLFIRSISLLKFIFN